MPQIVAMIHVADLVEWEKDSRDHAALFCQQTIEGHYEYTVIEQDNRVVLCTDFSDVDTFFEVLETAAAEDAKDLDGIRRDTIQFFTRQGVYVLASRWLHSACAANGLKLDD